MSEREHFEESFAGETHIRNVNDANVYGGAVCFKSPTFFGNKKDNLKKLQCTPEEFRAHHGPGNQEMQQHIIYLHNARNYFRSSTTNSVINSLTGGQLKNLSKAKIWECFHALSDAWNEAGEQTSELYSFHVEATAILCGGKPAWLEGNEEQNFTRNLTDTINSIKLATEGP